MKINVIIPCAPGSKIYAKNGLNRQGISDKEIICVEGKNPSKNRNIGAKKSTADLIAFTNTHSFFDKNWKENVISFFEKYPKVDIVGGPQLTSSDEGLFGRASGVAFSSIFGAANVRDRYTPTKTEFNIDETKITSANLICRKKVFNKIKFDETLYPGEDPKFISDAKDAGMLVAYCGNIVSYNQRRGSFPKLAKQIFGYGKVRPQKENFFQTLKKPLFFIPSLFVIGIFGIIFLSVLYSVNWLVFLDLYMILNLIFSSYESLKNKRISYFFVLPWIFLTIHISYGSGMIWGYFKKL